MHIGYYVGGTPANVSWQASQIAGGERHFGVTDHTRWSNAAQQGKEKNSTTKTTLHLLFVVSCRQNNSCHVC